MIKCLREKCGKEFEPTSPKSKFCSNKCRTYHHRENKAEKPKETVSFDEETLEKLAEILAGKINIQSATVKKVEGKSIATFSVEVEDDIARRSFNDYVEMIPKIKSIEECVALDAEVSKSDLEAWKKVELSKRIKLRSQHPDLN